MSTVTIRSVTIEDASLLKDLILQSFEQYRDRLDPPSGVFTETVEDIVKIITDGGGFIAFSAGQPIGAVLYEPLEGGIYLGRLGVLPEHRGKGAARLLVAAVENVALEMGFRHIWMGVRVVLPENRAMFERMGYQVIEAVAHAGYDHPTFYRMGKDL